ncbi:glycosyltransferase family 4 protein [Halostagnicola kamekurae]|uniref:Glycosyltransferase Family 4 n=1 Tax=Halostagnicola kamekurae TaxID=619731 RepID=A0A1I6UHB3_9EURY|nr:glycosyltransferase family 4 protein [Halostagnicola kamekurae]SFT00803.1 Glycosyltransferase Family 4 [Halostagnicola kamekurae]
MNIGFYHDAAGTRESGGIAVYTQRMATELARNHDVYLYTRSGERAAVLEGSDVTVVETPPIDSALTSALERVAPMTTQDVQKLEMTAWGVRNGVFEHIDATLDVLFTFQFLDDLFVSNLVDVPTVYAFHSLSTVGLGSALRERFSQTDLVLANSDPTARQISEKFGYDVDGIVYPGVDHEQFTPTAPPALESDDPIVLFVGRLVAGKGVFDLLEGVSKIEKSVELRLVGGGEADAVRARARDLGIADSVTVDGVVPHTALPGYYTAADVFCLPTHDESFGMATVEAMACGTVPVTTAIPGVQTYAVDGENSLLVDPGRPADLADALETVLDDPVARQALGRRAAEDARRYSWREQARTLERFCAETLDVEVSSESEPARPVELQTP